MNSRATLYRRRLVFMPLASALISVAETSLRPAFLWSFDEEVAQIVKEMRSRGAPPPHRMPSRRQILLLQLALGAARGFGFALVRPALPRRAEAAALVYSTIGASTLVAGF